MNEEETMIWNWGKKMQMHEPEGREMLRQRGFTPREIDRLIRLRRKNTALEQVVIEEDPRLQFVRWLVVNGKLTDQIT